MTSRSKALFIARSSRAKKAQDIVILDLRKTSNITDFFVILNGNSTRQVKAIADYIIDRLHQRGDKIWHIEGYQYAVWVLLDCGDVIVHLFTPAYRKFYALERLWGDAPLVQLAGDGKES